MIEKHGDLREDSRSDFDMTKKAEFAEKDGFRVADAANKGELHSPIAISIGNIRGVKRVKFIDDL